MQSIEEHLARRKFLKQLGAASTAALMAGEPKLFGATETSGEKLVQPEPTADACILIWMGGGMAAPETFDPKRYLPFEVGTPVEKILSTFPAIDTPVDNIKISAGLENVASVMDRATLIRSAVRGPIKRPRDFTYRMIASTKLSPSALM